MLLRQVKFLVRKEISLEIRQKYAVNGILLYVISAVFTSYVSFKTVVSPAVWNALFWIIMLFASMNAISKSFIQENRGRLIYLYTLASPQAIIIAKTLYNILLTSVLLGCCIFFYSLFIGNIVQDMALFMLVSFLGNAGFASILTLVSAIASKSGNSFSLMAILSFPVMIPLLITVIHASKNAVDGLNWSVSYQYLIVIAALNAIIWVLSYLLFPYLWPD